MFDVNFYFLYCIFSYYYFFLYFILKCKTIFYATCHFSGKVFLLMWTLYGASKGPFY
ncbi:unnamed protein product [Brassica napus]|uniref:(rape) hypothetical protein n=1 Tax=Brassica napus TaxID=3708 RepID=A0A816L7N6_BRANA|nr:unnamed protein product [Brassica napus]